MSPDEKPFNPGFTLIKGGKPEISSTEQPIEPIEKRLLSLFIVRRNNEGIITEVSVNPELDNILNERMSPSDMKYNEILVKRITGFSVGELTAKWEELRTKYIGQKESPFITMAADKF